MDYKDQFPVLAACTYLNTASSGILSRSLYQWRRAHEQQFLQQGSGFREGQAVLLQQTRDALSRFFHAGAHPVFLVPNFSFGWNTFLGVLPGKPRFLLLENEYPSILSPLQRLGFPYHTVPAGMPVEETVVEMVRHYRPDVFVCSLVQYISGLKISPNFLKALKALFPGLIIVADGTQFCGTCRFDFDHSAIDVLIASGYKWMLAGYGNGFVLLKQEMASRLCAGSGKAVPVAASSPEDFSALSRAFEPGHLDTLAFGSLCHSLHYLEAVGPDMIEASVNRLSHKAKEAFAAHGLLEPPVLKREEHAPIFNLSLSEKASEALAAASVICIRRGEGIRVGFHFYNSEEDLGRLLSVLKPFL